MRWHGPDGHLRGWITGEGGTCVDSHDHIFTLNRALVEVFDKMGVLKCIIPIDPEGFSYQPLRTNDIGFSTDQTETFFYTSDVGSGAVWILSQFIGVHTMAVDSKGNLYVSEGGGGRRTQKFVKFVKQ